MSDFEVRMLKPGTDIRKVITDLGTFAVGPSETDGSYVLVTVKGIAGDTVRRLVGMHPFSDAGDRILGKPELLYVEGRRSRHYQSDEELRAIVGEFGGRALAAAEADQPDKGLPTPATHESPQVA